GPLQHQLGHIGGSQTRSHRRLKSRIGDIRTPTSPSRAVFDVIRCRISAGSAHLFLSPVTRDQSEQKDPHQKSLFSHARILCTTQPVVKLFKNLTSSKLACIHRDIGGFSLMRDVFRLAAVVLLSVAATAVVQSQATVYRPPRLKDGKPDMNGVWQALNEA